MLRYDNAVLLRDLSCVSPKMRVTFAASCAERLFPAYEEFCKRSSLGKRDELANMLAQVWSHLLGHEMTMDQIQLMSVRCESLIPGEDYSDKWIDGQAYADDAAAALCYTLRLLGSDDPRDGVWVAERAYELTDYYVTHVIGLEDEEQVLGHPVVQAELIRQRRDLDELLEASQESAALFIRFQERAKVEASVFLTIATKP